MANETEEIKARLNLVELVQEYVPNMKRVGANWKGLCPFHTEKTPSFMVSEDKQIWHCFGCGKGGDHFGFIMESEGLEFVEALRLLADKAGVKLERRDPQVESKRNRLADLVRLAAEYYRKVLVESPKAEPARTYLKQRAIADATAETYQLGFAIESWDDCLAVLKKRNYTDEEIISAGLAVRSEKSKGIYNRFRGRLMFTFRDLHGMTVGFTGRLLDPEAKEVKYLNSPETMLYHKSAYVYGLYEAKAAIKKDRAVIVVEGNMDVLASYQAGVENVVASSGTALTAQQVRLLKRFASTVALCFDADDAGQSAARRGIDVLWEAGLAVNVITLPFGKDPDEVVRKDAAAWRAAAAAAVPVMEHYFTQAEKRPDIRELAGKKAVSSLLLSLIQKIPDAIEQTHYLQRLAKLVNVDESLLRSSIQPKTIRRRPTQPAETTPATHPSRTTQLGERLIAAGLAFPAEHLQFIIDAVTPEMMPTEALAQLYKAVIVQYTQATSGFSEPLAIDLNNASEQLRQLWRAVELIGDDLRTLDPAEVKQEILTAIQAIKREHYHRQLSRLETDLRQAENGPETQRVTALANELQLVMDELATLAHEE